ncbi:MAG: DUF4197 domain-containing protein [Candidatus Brocadia sp.]|nr:MAG: hypothetical protein B6D35_13110 [Candidatus Brocadia sp. UTAMX2]UJS20816.1 MAG: DUF4197 domain-containing protein [Candidatus Brocadia sp.]
MKKQYSAIMLVVMLTVGTAYGGFLSDLFKKGGTAASKVKLDESTVTAGIKEALSLATDKTVTSLSSLDGYFANKSVKIVMPEKIQKVADTLGKFGFQRQVDDFVLSMNRAAEKAAPVAREHFVDAIKQMTVKDARKILEGGDTAATDFFREKTYNKLYDSFKPTISDSMDHVGVTNYYKDMMGKFTAIPFMNAASVDLDDYVTNEALDGLFHMVGEEEKKIRKDPAARVTDLLKEVFGGAT